MEQLALNSKSLTYLKSNRSSTAPVTFNIDSYKTYIIFVNHDGGNNSVVSLIYAESNPKLIELYRVGAVFTINLKNKTLAITSSTTYWNYTIIYVWLNGILNSKTEIKSYDILYGSNQGHISAVSYGKVLIVEGYVTAQNTGIQYVLAKINDINAINVTQIIFQVGSMPTDPYCMFGSIELDGQITIGSSTKNTLYRFSAAVLIK